MLGTWTPAKRSRQAHTLLRTSCGWYVDLLGAESLGLTHSSKIQEAGLSFYSYAILSQVLRNRKRLVFLVLFWVFMLCVLMARLILLAYRIKSILQGDQIFKTIVNGAHVGYFMSLATVECLSAFFLLHTFAAAKNKREQASLGSDFMRHLMRSTEMRLALLALIGVARAITFLFQPPISGAVSTSSQIDVFLYSLECLFPVMLLSVS